jgi:hypothetical protein
MVISERRDEADLSSGDGKAAAQLIERNETQHSRLYGVRESSFTPLSSIHNSAG